MVDVAQEMERRGLDLPLLIGGATTSKQHTAVRIAPAYCAPTVHVLDASRVVGVVSDLLDPARRADARRARTASCRSGCASQHAESDAQAAAAPLAAARANRAAARLRRPAGAAVHGHARRRARRSRRSREYIDWQFFFHAWELKGKFPAILEQPAARELYDDAHALLDEIVAGGLLRRAGVYGFWPAHADGDDVVLADGDALLLPAPAGRPRRRAAEPLPRRLRRARRATTLGAFAVAIHGADELAARFEAEHDDYRAIMVKALADRLAEAFAEWLHAGRAARVVRAGRAPDERGADRGALPRHPAGVRLPGLPRPQREARSSSSCSSAARSGSS